MLIYTGYERKPFRAVVAGEERGREGEGEKGEKRRREKPEKAEREREKREGFPCALTRISLIVPRKKYIYIYIRFESSLIKCNFFFSIIFFIHARHVFTIYSTDFLRTVEMSMRDEHRDCSIVQVLSLTRSIILSSILIVSRYLEMNYNRYNRLQSNFYSSDDQYIYQYIRVPPHNNN